MHKGFTLLEVLIAATLLGVGVAAVLGGVRSVNASEARARQLEVMQRLAVDKYNEIRATTDTFSDGDSGDFMDRNIQDFTWTLEVEPTGVENVEGVTVTVQKRSQSAGDPVGSVSGTVFEAPQNTAPETGAGAGAGL